MPSRGKFSRAPPLERSTQNTGEWRARTRPAALATRSPTWPSDRKSKNSNINPGPHRPTVPCPTRSKSGVCPFARVAENPRSTTKASAFRQPGRPLLGPAFHVPTAASAWHKAPDPRGSPCPRPPPSRSPIREVVSSSLRTWRNESWTLIGHRPFRHSQRTPNPFSQGRASPRAPLPSPL